MSGLSSSDRPRVTHYARIESRGGRRSLSYTVPREINLVLGSLATAIKDVAAGTDRQYAVREGHVGVQEQLIVAPESGGPSRLRRLAGPRRHRLGDQRERLPH